MIYVLRRIGDNKYVAKQGSAHSYTRDFDRARRFPSEVAAEAEKCGNEFIERIG